MNSCIKLGVLFIALAIGNLIYFVNKTPTIPTINEDSWWAENDEPEKSEDLSIRPFTINISDTILSDLQHRLEHHRSITPSLKNAHQHYGIHSQLIAKFVSFWRNEYNWRTQEKFLNSLPQYHTRIQGLDVHFVHLKPQSIPPNTKVIPLLLLHGWPGSIREFYEMIPHLTTLRPNQQFVFEVIAPSLPGYGFSEGAKRSGLSAARMAVIFKILMERLGFSQFYAQGGDWGSMIATHLSVLYPDRIKGIHLNMCVSTMPITNFKMAMASVWPTLFMDTPTAQKLYPFFTKFVGKLLLESGYLHLQATKPDTVGVALTDSPIGLAAYMLEKFTTWTNADWKDLDDGGLTKKFTFTKLLDNIMIYWVTSSITTSVRLYAESFDPNGLDHKLVVPVKSYTACANFDHELFIQPVNFLKDRYPNLVHVSNYNAGHFAAFEEPELLANDIWMAINKMEALENSTSGQQLK